MVRCGQGKKISEIRRRHHSGRRPRESFEKADEFARPSSPPRQHVLRVTLRLLDPLGLRKETVNRGGFVTLPCQQSGFHSGLEVAAGRGRGDGFVKSQEILSRKSLLAEVGLGEFQTGFPGGGLRSNRLDQTLQRPTDHFEGKVDEGRRIPRPVGNSERLIVSGLMILDERLHRRELENRLVAAQQQAVPKAPDPSVPVLKRMNELQLIVTDRTLDQGMAGVSLEKIKQVFHQVGYPVRPGREMGNPGTVQNPHVAGAPGTGRR